MSYLDDVWAGDDLFGGKPKPKDGVVRKKGKRQYEKDFDNLKANLSDIRDWSRGMGERTVSGYKKSRVVAQKTAKTTKKVAKASVKGAKATYNALSKAYRGASSLSKKAYQNWRKAQIRKALKKKGIEVYKK